MNATCGAPGPMRALVLLLSCLVAGEAAALGDSLYPDLMEFDAAMVAYQAGELDRARRAFTHLAELGDPEAQFNLGVMLFKGEGGDADPVTGTAWIQWAADSGASGARQALPIVSGRLDEDSRAAVPAVLEAIKQANQPQAATREDRKERDEDEAYRCVAKNAHRQEPEYSQKTMRDRRVGFTRLHFLVSPEGNFDAVHAMPEGPDYGPFGKMSQRAVRRWTAHDCSIGRYMYTTQNIVFTIADFDGSNVLTSVQRDWLEQVLAEARAGGPKQAYIVAMLASLDADLFTIEQELVDRLLHHAAVGGFPDARYEYALTRAIGDHKTRWYLLAARQGHGPALFILHRRDGLPREERRQALLRAAEAGFLPAVLLAVRRLATHPDAAERDGARALQLSAALPKSILRDDPSMAEAHAMALAETGRFDDAASWQKRALRTGRWLGRDTRGAATRLAMYEAGKPWRDPLLSSAAATVDDD